MKRAKLLLAAVAVFAIAGGVYAAKAKRTAQLFCAPNPALACNVLKIQATTTDQGGQLTNCTFVQQQIPCAQTRTIFHP